MNNPQDSSLGKRQRLALLLASKAQHTEMDAPSLYRHPQKGLTLPEEFRSRERWLKSLDVEPPFFTQIDGLAKPECLCNGKPVINFSSYNYLGLADDERVIKAAQDAVELYGTSVSASRIASGERSIHTTLERGLAGLTGAQDALAFVGGFVTNESVISHLLGAGDLIIYDQLIHSSILQGALASGATRLEFPHNDLAGLDKLLATKRKQYNQCLIVVEGLYSMEGDICDLPGLIEIKKQHSAALMVDEAHSVGVLGATGRGVSEFYGVDSTEVDIWMGTLSKSLASCGGYIASSAELINYLRYTVPGFVFSAGIPPASTVAATRALEVMLEEPGRLERLTNNAQMLLQLGKAQGLDITLDTAYAVVPVFVRSAELAVIISSQLLDRGIYVHPAIAPAVPEGSERLRFFVTSEHTQEQINHAVEVTAELLKNA